MGENFVEGRIILVKSGISSEYSEAEGGRRVERVGSRYVSCRICWERWVVES